VSEPTRPRSARLARIVLAAAALFCLVVVPVVALTETRPERAIKSRLGYGGFNCQSSKPSPGWAQVASLPERRDEPRAAVIDGVVYLAGGIEQITDFGKPSGVRGVERVEVRSFDKLTRFDPRTQEYEELPPLPEPLNHIGMAAYGGDIYVVGGYGNLLNGLTAKRDFYRYSPASRRWTRLAPMPTARGAVATAVLGDRLYVIDGLALGREKAVMEAYDFGESRWVRLKAPPTAREHVAGAALDGAVYVIGGRDRLTDALDTVERYDPARDRWETLEPLPRGVGGLEAVPFDGRILAIGGGDDRGRTVTGAVQQYDPDTDAWRPFSWMRSPRHGFASALVGDAIYTFGGSRCALFNPVETVDVFRPREAGP
jgi:N-acetylneuraminic acid mutarotase